jgi:hypothetical protein
METHVPPRYSYSSDYPLMLAGTENGSACQMNRAQEAGQCGPARLQRSLVGLFFE